jgi:AcrR family transcriptional regulator
MAQPAAANSAPPGTRLDRRKARTRQALIDAAVRLIAEGRGERASIQEITEAADIGFGSFYNHFESKEQLFQAALEEALDTHGALLDGLTTETDDPAEVFARSFRLTGRLHRRQPELSSLLLRHGLAVVTSDRGVAPRARRDIEAAVRAGRFTVPDVDLAMTIVAGTALCLGQLLHDQPERGDADATDRVTADLLRVLGLPADEARELCGRPLPDLGDPAEGHTAA